MDGDSFLKFLCVVYRLADKGWGSLASAKTIAARYEARSLSLNTASSAMIQDESAAAAASAFVYGLGTSFLPPPALIALNLSGTLATNVLFQVRLVASSLR